MRIVGIVFAISILAAGMAVAQTVESGSFQVDLSDIEGPGPELVPHTPEGTVNALMNPGFESGSLDPWTSTDWFVTNDDSNSGTYSAEVIGNFRVCQTFPAVDVSEVSSITFYSMQPEGVALQAVDLFYEGEGSDQFLDSGPGVDWTLIDVTGDLRGSGSLNQICVWGYSGGGAGPDVTRLDDVTVQVAGGVPSLPWPALMLLVAALTGLSLYFVRRQRRSAS